MTQKTMTEKDLFVHAWEHEFQITLRVLHAIPAGKEDFRPAPKSRTVRELVGIILAGETIIEGALAGNMPTAPPPTASLSTADQIRQYETLHRAVIAKVNAAPEARLDATIPFPVGPGQMADLRVGEVMWFVSRDHIHHRGQMSVYLRMLGAPVPAIYGPSADEPWR